MENAGNERLVGDAFFQGAGLYVSQVWRRKANVHAPILERGGLGRRLEKLFILFGWLGRYQFAALICLQKIFFEFINLFHGWCLHPDSL